MRISFKAGPIPVSRGVRRRLVMIRAQLGIDVEPTVTMAEIEALEAKLGSVVPNELIAIFASLGRSLNELDERTADIEEYYGGGRDEERWRELDGDRFEHIAFDAWLEESDHHVCYRRTDDPVEAPIVTWSLEERAECSYLYGDNDDNGDLGDSFEEYLEWRYANAVGIPQRVSFSGKIERADLEALVPTVVDGSAKKDPQYRHAKFGEGVLVEKLDGDKLKIDFGEHGVKTMLARTLETL